MKTNNIITSSKEFTKVANRAKKEIKQTFSSVYVICNLLNKAFKNDFSKLENVSFTYVDLQKVGATLLNMHGKRYAFEVPALLQLANNTYYYHNGKVCFTAHSKKCPKFGFDLVNVDTTGWYYTKELNLSIDSVFAAFCKVVRYELKATEKAAKDKKDYDKMYNCVASVFGAEYTATLTKETIVEKYNLIKNAK